MTLQTSTVSIDLSGSTPMPGYDIVIGEGIFSSAGELIKTRLGARRCVIVSDSNVAPLYQKPLEDVLRNGGHTVLKTLVFPAGEASKNFGQLQSLLNQTLALGIDRKTLIIALGGGVVGDMAGLMASLAMRGIDFVQMPTTLLAHADSSVGGKTGIDTDYGKNTVGTFYQPRLVISDVALLDTLPKRELFAGYAEVVKYGLIGDRNFFGWCKEHGKEVVSGNHAALVYAIKHSCEAKAAVVAEDEREAGKRALLNFGHTFGHALESATGFGSTLIHGEAVAIGSLMAFRMAVKMGLCPESDAEEVHAHFEDVGMQGSPPKHPYNIDQLIGFMATDKKADNGKITLVLPHGIGNAVVHKGVDAGEIRKLWEETLK